MNRRDILRATLGLGVCAVTGTTVEATEVSQLKLPKHLVDYPIKVLETFKLSDEDFQAYRLGLIRNGCILKIDCVPKVSRNNHRITVENQLKELDQDVDYQGVVLFNHEGFVIGAKRECFKLDRFMRGDLYVISYTINCEYIMNWLWVNKVKEVQNCEIVSG